MATSSRSRRTGPQDPCFEKALDLLSRRPHFRRELERKLSMREFDETEIRTALDRAEESGFLDDLECARQLARVRVERRLEGPARLYATLARRGADSDTARQVVAEYFSGGERRWLEEAAAKWLGRHDWDRNRLARHLNSKGFSTAAILDGLDRLRSAEGEGVG